MFRYLGPLPDKLCLELLEIACLDAADPLELAEHKHIWCVGVWDRSGRMK